MKSKPASGVDRREFLQVSSAVAAGAVLIGPEILASGLTGAPERLAVGFVNYILDDHANPLEIVAAREIIGTDPAFLQRDARISVVSSGRALLDPKSRRGVELNANFTYFDGAQRRTAPFHAWTYDRTTGDAGNSISFLVPVDDQQQIRLSLGTEVSGTASTARRRSVSAPGTAPDAFLPFTLSLRDEPDSYRLVRGYFVLVPLAVGQAEPSWSSYALWHRNGHWGVHEGADLRPAAMEHLVIRVNYAA